MKSRTISVRRRQMMIAGIAGAAAPAALYAGQFHGRHGTGGELVAAGGEDGLVISGRILARNGRPLAGAVVEVWHASAHRDTASATTDGDGRFFATIAPARNGRPKNLHYRVSRAGRTLATQQLHFARGRNVSEHSLAHLQRDDTGAWRAAFGVTLA